MKTFVDLGIDTKGKVSGEIKTICPQCSHTRKKQRYPCLNVNLDSGVFHCWHCDWSGGLGRAQYSRPAIVKSYRKPDYVAQSTGLPDNVLAWFAKRGIGEAVLRRNQIAHGSAYFPQVEDNRTAVLFPYRRRGEVVNVKYRTADKLFRMEGGCERVLYGLDDVGACLTWVEGEIDKLSLEAAGITSCVSVPDGAPAPNSKAYESKFDFLDAPELSQVATHVIAVDSDAPGQRLRDELVRRLGAAKCRIVDWPDGCKDANDVLVQLGVDVLLGCVNDARELPIEGAHAAEDYEPDVARLYRDGIPSGVSTGWASLDAHYNVRAGDVTVVTGAPNSGKSEFIDALAINLANRYGWRLGVFSPEQGSPAEHIAKFIEKKTGLPFSPGPSVRVSQTQLDQSLTWLSDHFFWLVPKEPDLSSLLAIARELVLRKGIKGLVLDPWNEIEHAVPENLSESNYIGECLRLIRVFSRQNQVHTWIAAHPKMLQKDKRTGQYPVVGPYEISGSANWHNKPDVILSIHRDRAPGAGTAVDVHVQKVRSKHVGCLGTVRLDWNRINGRYSDPAAADLYRNRDD